MPTIERGNDAHSPCSQLPQDNAPSPKQRTTPVISTKGRDFLVACSKDIFPLLTDLNKLIFAYFRLSGGEYSQPINPQYSPTYWAWGR